MRSEREKMLAGEFNFNCVVLDVCTVRIGSIA